MLRANRAGARALVVELDRAGTLIKALATINQLKLRAEVVSHLLFIAEQRFNAAIKMAGERPARSKLRAA
jgi:hypothetical protein